MTKIIKIDKKTMKMIKIKKKSEKNPLKTLK